ncbi:hypothetical protein ACHAWF_016577, partial [Thalassiosira exigua]
VKHHRRNATANRPSVDCGVKDTNAKPKPFATSAMLSIPDAPSDICANCGKGNGKGEEENVNLKACTACKMVKYCNRDCQIAHRPQHKKACKKRVTELHDEALFRQPPQNEDCPICYLPLPLVANNIGVSFKTCCGKRLCNGCIHAQLKEEIRSGKEIEKVGVCAFCRKVDAKTDEERLKQINVLVEKGNADAIATLARYHAMGEMDFPQDMARSSELLHRAGELGCAEAYYNLGNAYYFGRGVERDDKKKRKYWELAAMSGNVNARSNLGTMEGYAGNDQRAYRHFIIAARAGDEGSLKNVKEGFMGGMVTRDEYADALTEYQKRQDETKSEMRVEAGRYQANPLLYAEVNPSMYAT